MIENVARSSAGRNNLEPIKPPEIRRPIFKSFCNNSNMDYQKLSLTGQPTLTSLHQSLSVATMSADDMVDQLTSGIEYGTSIVAGASAPPMILNRPICDTDSSKKDHPMK